MLAPNAYPLSVTMSSPLGAKLLIVGGLTKLELGALQIAAGLAAHGLFEGDDVASRAVAIAARVLSVAAQREQAEASALSAAQV